MAWLPVKRIRVFMMTPNFLPVCAWALQARTHVQLACQQSMPNVQHGMRLAMQHVYGHISNVGDECADHAAALGALGFVHARFFMTLILFFMMLATTLVNSWNCMDGFSITFTHEMHQLLFCSQLPFPRSFFALLCCAHFK